MCIPAFMYPHSRISEEVSSMPIPDNAKGFPVVEDAFIKNARLQLMIGLMNQTMGNQQNRFRVRQTTTNREPSDPVSDLSATPQQPGFGQQQEQNPGSGNFGP